jgi:hypothetical protein
MYWTRSGRHVGIEESVRGLGNVEPYSAGNHPREVTSRSKLGGFKLSHVAVR